MVGDNGKWIVGAIIALACFLAGAIVDAFITVWVFKRYGGCPFIDKKKARAV